MREYIHVLRLMLGVQPNASVDYIGEYHQLEAFRRARSLIALRIPLLVETTGARMV